MHRRGIWIGVFSILVAAGMALSGMGSIVSSKDMQHRAVGLSLDDFVDQQQTECDTYLTATYDSELVQGFVPCYGILTRVEVLMAKNYSATPGHQIAIREKYDGPNLVTVDFEDDNPEWSFTWKMFDFNDIFVTPGETYYIAWTGWHGADQTKNYHWGCATDNLYEDAGSYFYFYRDKEWYTFRDVDFCFKTYGAENKPPDTPDTPSGESYIEPDGVYTFETVTSDPEEHDVQYGWDWDGDDEVDEWTEFFKSGVQISTPHTFYVAGDFCLKVKARDIGGVVSDWSSCYSVMVVNKPPGRPYKPTGPTEIEPSMSYTYSSSATDPNKDDVYVLFDWGDGTDSGWLGPYCSGETVSASHAWSEVPLTGYNVRVKAKDEDGLESDWSGPLLVPLSKSSSPQRCVYLLPPDAWLTQFLERCIVLFLFSG